MASDAANSTVLLELLDRHLENKPLEPHEQAEITINEVKHEVVSSTLDFLVNEPASSLLAARVILTIRDISRPEGVGDKPTTELAAHITTRTSPDRTAPSSSLVILDEKPQAQDGPHPAPAPPHRASTIPTQPLTDSSSSNTTRQPLAETYREYIQTFMADATTATARLPHFLHQPVTHNTRPLTITEYHNLGQVVRDAIPDLGCEIVDLIADEGRQVVAARLEFAGTLVRPFAGAPQPPAGGRAVRIGEVVFYWFDAGRIREVVSLVDMGGLGAEST